MYTGRKDFCMKPEFWHAADYDSTEYEVLELVSAFVRALQPEVVVETGSCYGIGSARIARALKANGHGKLYSLEINPERAETARAAVEGLPAEIVLGDSMKWCPPNEIGFCFFDSYPELRALEFRRYKPFMVPGAIVSFHDAAPHHSVYWFSEELEKEKLLKPIRLHTPRGVVFAEVL
jgi:predicted O-methyltransferase YrrM